MYAQVPTDVQRSVNDFLPGVDLARVQLVSRRTSEAVGVHLVLTERSDVRNELIRPCQNGEIDVITLTLRVSPGAHPWRIDPDLGPIPLPRLRRLCVRWMGNPKPGAYEPSVELPRNVWTLARAVAASAPALDTVRISSSIRIPFDRDVRPHPLAVALERLSVGIESDRIIRAGRADVVDRAVRRFDAVHLNLVVRPSADDDSDADTDDTGNAASVVRFWNALLRNQRMQSIRVHSKDTHYTPGVDPDPVVPPQREVWLHDTSREQIVDWWLLSCGARTLHASVALDWDDLIRVHGPSRDPVNQLRGIRDLPRCPRLHLHLFVWVFERTDVENAIEIISAVRDLGWDRIVVHAVRDGPSSDSLRTYRDSVELRTAWNRWGVDGTVGDGGVAPNHPPAIARPAPPVADPPPPAPRQPKKRKT